jgi:hypothetical protein
VIVFPVLAIPVPPFAPMRVPESVTEPVVPVLGVSPVVPAEKVVTLPALQAVIDTVPLAAFVTHCPVEPPTIGVTPLLMIKGCEG